MNLTNETITMFNYNEGAWGEQDFDIVAEWRARVTPIGQQQYKNNEEFGLIGQGGLVVRTTKPMPQHSHIMRRGAIYTRVTTENWAKENVNVYKLGNN